MTKFCWRHCFNKVKGLNKGIRTAPNWMALYPISDRTKYPAHCATMRNWGFTTVIRFLWISSKFNGSLPSSCCPSSGSKMGDPRDPWPNIWGKCTMLVFSSLSLAEMSGIHPFLNLLACSRSQDAGIYPSMHWLPVYHTEAGTHRQTYSYSCSHLQAI